MGVTRGPLHAPAGPGRDAHSTGVTRGPLRAPAGPGPGCSQHGVTMDHCVHLRDPPGMLTAQGLWEASGRALRPTRLLGFLWASWVVEAGGGPLLLSRQRGSSGGQTSPAQLEQPCPWPSMETSASAGGPLTAGTAPLPPRPGAHPEDLPRGPQGAPRYSVKTCDDKSKFHSFGELVTCQANCAPSCG